MPRKSTKSQPTKARKPRTYARPAARAAPARRRAAPYKKPGYGQRLGSFIGEGADLLFSKVNPLKIFGFGDYAPYSYDVRANTLLSMGNSPPEIQNKADGRVILRHREYIKDIVTGATSAFTVQSFPIQPADANTFPWLSTIAHCFEQYRLRGMIFEFKSTSADALNSTNTALGTVIMATEYDASRGDFTSKAEMENHQYAASARQSCSMLHPIECDRSQSTIDILYINEDPTITGPDLRFNDFGRFQIATVGQQGASVNIGELWVTYEIELLKPHQPTNDEMVGWSCRNIVGFSGLNLPMGTSEADIGVSNINSDIITGTYFTTGTCQFNLNSQAPSGYYLLSYLCEGAADDNACTVNFFLDDNTAGLWSIVSPTTAGTGWRGSTVPAPSGFVTFEKTSFRRQTILYKKPYDERLSSLSAILRLSDSTIWNGNITQAKFEMFRVPPQRNGTFVALSTTGLTTSPDALRLRIKHLEEQTEKEEKETPPVKESKSISSLEEYAAKLKQLQELQKK